MISKLMLQLNLFYIVFTTVIFLLIVCFRMISLIPLQPFKYENFFWFQFYRVPGCRRSIICVLFISTRSSPRHSSSLFISSGGLRVLGFVSRPLSRRFGSHSFGIALTHFETSTNSTTFTFIFTGYHIARDGTHGRRVHVIRIVVAARFHATYRRSNAAIHTGPLPESRNSYFSIFEKNSWIGSEKIPGALFLYNFTNIWCDCRRIFSCHIKWGRVLIKQHHVSKLVSLNIITMLGTRRRILLLERN